MVSEVGSLTDYGYWIHLQPLRELLRSRNAWCWGPDQEASFKALKQELIKPVVLAMYDAQDASSYGLGAVLLQSKGNDWRPVAYASRALSDTERRYAQIEEEALASTWACEKFSNYILGRPFLLESDHKPLIPLLSTKHLPHYQQHLQSSKSTDRHKWRTRCVPK